MIELAPTMPQIHSSYSFLQAMLVLIVLILLSWTLYVAYFGSLSKIPGPWYARFTTLYLKIQTFRGHRMHYLHSLHREYGGMVRISPAEISVADINAFREIHRIGGGFFKPNWYIQLRGDLDVFSIADTKAHAARRKVFARSFSNSSLRKDWEVMIKEKTSLAMSKIREEARLFESVDVMKWWKLLTADIVTQLSFGESFKMIEAGKTDANFDKIEQGAMLGMIRADSAGIVSIIKHIPFPPFTIFENTRRSLKALGLRAVESTRNKGLGKKNVFSNILERKENGSEVLTDDAISSEAAGLIIAGSGTTAVTLTYLVWAVCRHPHIQLQLEQEIRSLGTDYTDQDLENLPFLSAVIEETLRLYGAAPGSLPRVVPKAGALLGGYHLPGGTIVSTQAFTYHRDPETFPDPERFDPTRFLSDRVLTDREKIAFAPFGAGARICLGINLARMELRHITCAFFREFAGAKLADKTTDETMEMVNYFLIAPAARSCHVILGDGS